MAKFAFNPQVGHREQGLIKRIASTFMKQASEGVPKSKAISYHNPQTRFSNTQKFGVPKYGQASFHQLRHIAAVDTIIRICINVIKKEVSQAKWCIRKKNEEVEIDEKQKQAALDLFNFVNFEGENMRMLLDRLVEDILVLDAGPVELLNNIEGEIVGLNSVDGATIRPNINQYGEFGDIAYYQILQENNYSVVTKPVAEFQKSELMYIMASPQNDVYRFGYGLSPIESILMTVQTALDASVYNSSLFAEDNVPPGVLHLGNVMEDEAEVMKEMWNAQTNGQTMKLKFTFGPEQIQYIPFQNSNKDMQYMEMLDWLTRQKLATYGLSAIDANITQDVNRSTADVQQAISNARGVMNMKRLLEEAFNNWIFRPMGWDTIEFGFEELPNLKNQFEQAKIDEIYVTKTGIMLESEVRDRMGLPPLEDVSDSDDMEITPEEKEDIKNIKDEKKEKEEKVGKVISNNSKYPRLY